MTKRLVVHPKRDSKDRDAVRTFMVVSEDDDEQRDEALVSRAAPLVWEIRKANDNPDDDDIEEKLADEKQWIVLDPTLIQSIEQNNAVIRVNTAGLPPGRYLLRARRGENDWSDIARFSAATLPSAKFIDIESELPRKRPATRAVETTLGRAQVPFTRDQALWVAIRASTSQLRFSEYQDFVDRLLLRWSGVRGHDARSVKRMLDAGHARKPGGGHPDLQAELGWLLSNYGPYQVLRRATEIFVMTRCGVLPDHDPIQVDLEVEAARFGHTLPDRFGELWQDYLVKLSSGSRGDHTVQVLPYLDIIRRKLGDVSSFRDAGILDEQWSLLQEKLVYPCMLELIWSYWHEESMLVQTVNAISQRFQNVRSASGRDPLAQLEIDPLRPLNQLLWGFIQDEPNRLSVLRRAHEYDHQYGFTLHGKATAELRTTDRRSKFLESFHNLLYLCSQFYHRDDDTTVIADAFPILNAIKETHYLLAHGAHNQFSELPATARQEMLMQQYMLARPEMREFLGGRVMVPYPEAWMDRVDVVKNIKGWTDTSVVHFRDLGAFGEQVVLSIRYGAWSLVDDPNCAANWARYWRAEVQGYMHAYRAVTGVDLTAELSDQRQATERYLPPSVHLRNRLLATTAGR